MSTPEEISSTAPATPAAAKKPVIATVFLLERAGGGSTKVVGRLEFDARPIITGMSTEEREQLRTTLQQDDALVHEAMQRGFIPAHNGPVHIDVAADMDAALKADPATFDEPYDHSRTVRHPEAVLQTPLSPYEIGMWVDENGFVTGLATIDFSQLIENDVEEVNDLLGEILVGSEILMQPTATPVRVDEDGTLVVRIEGDASTIIDGFDGDELEAYEAGLALNPSGGPSDDASGLS